LDASRPTVAGSRLRNIKLINLDQATGGRLASNPRMHSIAFTNDIEAPFIYHHDNFHYLFVRPLEWGADGWPVLSSVQIRSPETNSSP